MYSTVVGPFLCPLLPTLETGAAFEIGFVGAPDVATERCDGSVVF